jgi:hypothetical protein
MRHIRITNFYKQSPQGNPFGKEMMGRLLIKWLCLTGAVLFAAYVLDGIYVKDFFSAIFAAAVLGILNMSFRPSHQRHEFRIFYIYHQRIHAENGFRGYFRLYGNRILDSHLRLPAHQYCQLDTHRFDSGKPDV